MRTLFPGCVQDRLRTLASCSPVDLLQPGVHLVQAAWTFTMLTLALA